MKVNEIMRWMEEWAPLTLQDDWDNSGLQIGCPDDPVHGVLVSLDCTSDTIQYAMEKNCNLIITHHPILFKPIRNITSITPLGRIIQEVIRNHLSIYAAHTNLDMTVSGVSDHLANKLGLLDGKVLVTGQQQDVGLGRYGWIKETSVREFIADLKDKLGLDHVILFGNPDRKIKKIAVVGGSGGSTINTCLSLNIDLLITSEIKYHDMLQAHEEKLDLLDIGHYESEKIIVNEIANYLRSNCQDSFPVHTFQQSYANRLIY